MEVPKIVEYLNTYGLLGMFVILAVALYNKWIVMGYQLTDKQNELNEIKAERNELLRYHFRGLKVFSKVISGREITPKPGIVPEEDLEE